MIIVAFFVMLLALAGLFGLISIAFGSDGAGTAAIVCMFILLISLFVVGFLGMGFGFVEIMVNGAFA